MNTHDIDVVLGRMNNKNKQIIILSSFYQSTSPPHQSGAHCFSMTCCSLLSGQKQKSRTGEEGDFKVFGETTQMILTPSVNKKETHFLAEENKQVNQTQRTETMGSAHWAPQI